MGTIAALMATMPEVSCFSVGALGKTNRVTASFLARLADLGSKNPERFGCCNGKEQAQGVVASFLGRSLGRTLLRGVVRGVFLKLNELCSHRHSSKYKLQNARI